WSFFFFQAEDGIRDWSVTGVQTCALPIWPCFLIGEVGAILPMSPGKARRHHYEYEKHGSCCVLLAFEPHTGLRYVEVRQQRTARSEERRVGKEGKCRGRAAQ